jgi:HEXXH motif-containing protein
MTTFHELPPGVFDELAQSRGGREAINALQSAQLSKHLLLIGHLLHAWPDSDPERAGVTAALERARAASPPAFNAAVGAPLVGAWAGIAARAAGRGGLQRPDLMHLGAIALVACADAGVPAEVRLPVHRELAVLPGWGAAEAGAADEVRARTDGTSTKVFGTGPTVDVPGQSDIDSDGWLPVRTLTAAPRRIAITVTLDDLHPYRHGHHVPPAPRLSRDEVARWQALFEEAWYLLATYVPDRATELSAGLRTLVPLLADEHAARSATIRHAFGVFGLSRPPSPEEFAVTMVHEFQHSKLSALLDLAPLSDPDDRELHFAPWRRDPRPLAGLLQGVYAFAGVADTWRALRAVDGLGEHAEVQFAATRLQVDHGLRAVERSRGLTNFGLAFTERLRAATDELLAEQLPRAIVDQAELDLRRLHRRWLDRQQSTA